MMTLEAKYQQKILARKIYCEGFQSTNYSFELGLLALYLRDVKHLKVSERMQRLKVFCQKHYPEYHPRADYMLIEQAMKFSVKKENRLVEIEGVRVYREELDKIDELSEDDNERRAMFAMMVKKKVDRAVFEQRYEDRKYKSYLSHSVKENVVKTMAKQARIAKKVDVFSNVLHGLLEKKLIDFMPRGNMLLLYLKELPDVSDCSDEVSVWVPVSGFGSAGLYYDWLRGSRHVALCTECGAAFWKQSNRQRFCSEHNPEKIGKPETHMQYCKRCSEVYWVSNKNHKDIGICKECRECLN